MNFLTGMISGVKAIFGSGKSGSDNVMKVASGIGGWIDGQQFTAQEKAAFSADMIPHFQAFMDSTVKENTQRSITRREIALWIIRNWIVMLWVSIAAYGFELVISATQHEFSAFVLGIATLQAMIYLVLGVGGFFFGAHIIRTADSHIKKADK